MKIILVLFLSTFWIACGHFITKPSIIHATNKKWNVIDELFVDVGGPVVLLVWETALALSDPTCLDNCEKGK